MEPQFIITLCFSAVTTIAAIVSIIATARKAKREFAERETGQALLASKVETLAKSLDHAHDKIRDLYSKSNDTSNVITEIKANLQENTRVLRKVEEALTLVARIEERIDAHMREGK